MRIRTSLYKRKDGRWEGYVIYEDPDTGEDGKKSFYGRGNYGQDVRLQMNEFVRKLEAGDYSDIKKLTVEGWLKRYVDVYCTDVEQTTLDGYKNYINNHMIPFMGNILLKTLRPMHIQRFFNHERSVKRTRKLKNGETVPVMRNGKQVIGYSEKTILQEYRILHRAFEKAVGDGLISKNPCTGVDAPSPDEYTPTIYSEQEFLLMLDKLKGHRMEAVILIAGMCGLRRGEFQALTWENIDLEKGIIFVEKNVVPTSEGIITKDPKTKKGARKFSIPSVIIPRLKQLRGIGLVHTRIDGGEYNPGSVSRAFSYFLAEKGLKHIRLHDLRHFNATMMLKHGVTERETMERLGHSNSTQTKKYQHILEDMDKTSAEKLNRVFDINGPRAQGD